MYGLTQRRADDLAMTRVLISAALEADWEDGKEGDAAHPGVPIGLELGVQVRVLRLLSPIADAICRGRDA